MPSMTSGMLRGKAQAKMPSPKSGTYKKLVAAAKTSAANKSARPKSPKKKRNTQTFSSTEARRRALERVKCIIWQNLEAINDGIIRLAVSGNYMAARALYDIAGVYVLPPFEEAAARALPSTPAVDPGSEPGCAAEEIDPFFRSLGIEPLREPEPGMAAAAL